MYNYTISRERVNAYSVNFKKHCTHYYQYLGLGPRREQGDVCFDASVVVYCQNKFEPYLSDKDEHFYTIFQYQNRETKKCPVSGSRSYPSALI